MCQFTIIQSCSFSFHLILLNLYNSVMRWMIMHAHISWIHNKYLDYLQIHAKKAKFANIGALRMLLKILKVVIAKPSIQIKFWLHHYIYNMSFKKEPTWIYLEKTLLQIFSHNDKLKHLLYVKQGNVSDSGNNAPPSQEKCSRYKRIRFQV